MMWKVVQKSTLYEIRAGYGDWQPCVYETKSGVEWKLKSRDHSDVFRGMQRCIYQVLQLNF